MASAFLDPAPLVADLGDFAHAALCYVHGHSQHLGVFEFGFTEPPAPWNYLVFAGLEPLVHQLRQFRIAPKQIEYLRTHPAFVAMPAAWFSHLGALAFHGEVWSVREGTVVFGAEPLIRIVAPLDVGHLLGHYLLGPLAEQIRIASHWSRLVTAAAGRLVYLGCGQQAVDRQAALLTARAAYLAGAMATTDLEAARVLDIPGQLLLPTAWPVVLGNEVDAFQQYGEQFATACVPVVDTYAALTGVEHAIASGAPVQAVRLSGGDLYSLSRAIRRLLDSSHRQQTRILVDVGDDEQRIDTLVRQGARLDGFVIAMPRSPHAGPVFKSTYQLVAVADPHQGWAGRCRSTPGHVSYPYPKQVRRQHHEDGSLSNDVITMDGEEHEGTALLCPVMRNGELSEPLPSLEESRDHCVVERVRLPAALLDLEWSRPGNRVCYSDRMTKEMTRLAGPTS